MIKFLIFITILLLIIVISKEKYNENEGKYKYNLVTVNNILNGLEQDLITAIDDWTFDRRNKINKVNRDKQDTNIEKRRLALRRTATATLTRAATLTNLQAAEALRTLPRASDSKPPKFQAASTFQKLNSQGQYAGISGDPHNPVKNFMNSHAGQAAKVGSSVLAGSVGLSAILGGTIYYNQKEFKEFGNGESVFKHGEVALANSDKFHWEVIYKNPVIYDFFLHHSDPLKIYSLSININDDRAANKKGVKFLLISFKPTFKLALSCSLEQNKPASGGANKWEYFDDKANERLNNILKQNSKKYVEEVIRETVYWLSIFSWYYIVTDPDVMVPYSTSAACDGVIHSWDYFFKEFNILDENESKRNEKCAEIMKLDKKTFNCISFSRMQMIMMICVKHGYKWREEQNVVIQHFAKEYPGVKADNY